MWATIKVESKNQYQGSITSWLSYYPVLQLLFCSLQEQLDQQLSDSWLPIILCFNCFFVHCKSNSINNYPINNVQGGRWNFLSLPSTDFTGHFGCIKYIAQPLSVWRIFDNKLPVVPDMWTAWGKCDGCTRPNCEACSHCSRRSHKRCKNRSCTDKKWTEPKTKKTSIPESTQADSQMGTFPPALLTSLLPSSIRHVVASGTGGE